MNEKKIILVPFENFDEMMKDFMPVGEELVFNIMKFVNEWLEDRGMEVIQDNPELETVVVNSVVKEGGKISFNFHFRKKT